MIRLLLFAVLVVLGGCGSTPAPEATTQAEMYTCSMHPHVVQEGPGSCPICGMDLTPMGAKGETTVVEITPGIVQQIGVETAPVEEAPRSFATFERMGEVEVGEDEVARS